MLMSPKEFVLLFLCVAFVQEVGKFAGQLVVRIFVRLVARWNMMRPKNRRVVAK